MSQQARAEIPRGLLAVMHRHLGIRSSTTIDQQSQIFDLRAEERGPDVAQTVEDDLLVTVIFGSSPTSLHHVG